MVMDPLRPLSTESRSPLPHAPLFIDHRFKGGLPLPRAYADADPSVFLLLSRNHRHPDASSSPASSRFGVVNLLSKKDGGSKSCPRQRLLRRPYRCRGGAAAAAAAVIVEKLRLPWGSSPILRIPSIDYILGPSRSRGPQTAWSLGFSILHLTSSFSRSMLIGQNLDEILNGRPLIRRRVNGRLRLAEGFRDSIDRKWLIKKRMCLCPRYQMTWIGEKCPRGKALLTSDLWCKF